MPETFDIETEHLSKRFKDTVAVDDLNLRVGRGEILGLVGPDGAGKTTTIRLLAAIMDPTSGSARVLGHDTRHAPEPIKARIGYMAQRFNLYGDLSVSENLDFFGDVFEVPPQEQRERTQRLLHFARLEAFRDRRAAHLSGGMQKKLALACTLIHRPQLILLDEPTTGVDPVARREFWQILMELHVQGITLVVSTPYMDEAERCTRVALMYRGALAQFDTPQRIRDMVEGELVVLRAADLRAAQRLVGEIEGVREVQTFGDQLRLLCDDAEATMARIRERLAAEDVGLDDMRTARPRMEEAFISLIRRQRDAADLPEHDAARAWAQGQAI